VADEAAVEDEAVDGALLPGGAATGARAARARLPGDARARSRLQRCGAAVVEALTCGLRGDAANAPAPDDPAGLVALSRRQRVALRALRSITLWMWMWDGTFRVWALVIAVALLPRDPWLAYAVGQAGWALGFLGLLWMFRVRAAAQSVWRDPNTWRVGDVLVPLLAAAAQRAMAPGAGGAIFDDDDAALPPAEDGLLWRTGGAWLGGAAPAEAQPQARQVIVQNPDDEAVVGTFVELPPDAPVPAPAPAPATGPAPGPGPAPALASAGAGEPLAPGDADSERV
jgi:hypothetical protein